MAKYRYKGRNSRGEATEGVIEARSSDAVASQLFNSGITPVSINVSHEAVDHWADLQVRLGLGRPSIDELVLFSRQMHTLLRAGVPIIRAISGLSENSRNVMLCDVLKSVNESLESGRDLAGALSKHKNIFSSLYVSIIQVGESSGQLDQSFLQMSQYLELEKQTRSRIKSALRYPSFVIAGITIAMFIINIFVIPQFASVFAAFKAELPLPTQLLMRTSEFSVAYWPHMLVLLIGAIVGFRYYINTEDGRYWWDRVKLRIPLVGDIILRSTLARFSRSFAMALRSGVPLIQTLTVVSRAVDNEYVAERVLSMRNGVERGESLTQTAVATNMFTPLVLQMFNVGDETGKVDDMLQEVADYYEREVDYDLKRLADAIEPIMIVVVGIMVLILALGVFLPMWELARSAGNAS